MVSVVPPFQWRGAFPTKVFWSYDRVYLIRIVFQLLDRIGSRLIFVKQLWSFIGKNAFSEYTPWFHLFIGWNPQTLTLTLGKGNLQLNVVKPKQKGLSGKSSKTEEDDSLQLESVLQYKLQEVTSWGLQ